MRLDGGVWFAILRAVASIWLYFMGEGALLQF